MMPRPLISTLFPYTTLFRSEQLVAGVERQIARQFVLDGCRVFALADHHQRFDDEAAIGALFLGAVGEFVGNWQHHDVGENGAVDRKSTRLNSSHVSISYAVF